MSKLQIIMLSSAALIVVGTAYVHGIWTDRWEKQVASEKLRQYSERLDQVPTSFGDWESIPQEVDPAQFKESGCDHQFSRLFTNSVTGEQISVFLVSGRGYHVTIHTPEFCYKAAGYDQQAEEVTYALEAPNMPSESEFVHALFKKDTATESSHLRILWTFAVKDEWRSPKFAKYNYGGEDAMYKLYLIRSIAQGVPEIGNDPAVGFAKELLPILNQTLFPADASADPPEETASNVAKAEEVVEG